MRLFPREMEIGPVEGFTPEKDIFGRKPFADQLTRIVRALEDPSVLLLDSPWGTGKTTFVKMWRGELAKSEVPSVYFDAFANDYQEDAFLAVAGQIIAEAESLAPRQTKILKTFKRRALETAKIGRASLRVGVRAATAGFVEGEDLEKAAGEITKDVGDETTNIVDELLKSRLENHNLDRKIFENFKKTLAELAGALSFSGNKKNEDLGTNSSEGKPSRPLVFIIDELDRCRPSFALEILEKIKHFFSVDRVVFVLVSSLSQLEKAVCFAYGDIDAHTYLEKFYHLRILFPIGRPDRPDLGAAKYLHHLQCNRYLIEIVEQFSRVHPLSLRTLERIAAYAKLVEAANPKNALFIPQIVSVLCIIRVVWPKTYEAVRSSSVTAAQLDELMHFRKWHDQNNPNERSRLSERVENMWLYALGVLNTEEEKRVLIQGFAQYSFDAPSIIPHFCRLMDEFALPGS